MSKMRLIVFTYDSHYPGGGTGDCIYDQKDKIKVFNSLDEIKKYKPENGWEEWIEVLDLDTLEIIASENEIDR